MDRYGYFTISLDFELLWGVLDLPSCEDYKKNVDGGRTAIPQILALFSKYGIHATWATVGLMMNDSKDEMINRTPSRIPMYKNSLCSAYHHFDEVGESEHADEYHYGNSLIETILKTPNQELGTHTYSHYYVTEEGADNFSLESDIICAKQLLQDKFGVQCKSIVFPRNQCTEDSIKVVSNEGIICYRGNPDKGYDYSKKGLAKQLQRIGRYLDSYFPIYGAITYDIKEDKCTIINVAASRFFRPYSGYEYLEKLKIKRIKGQMLDAAKKGKMFHLWWHPHNFGTNTAEMLSQLEDIASYYLELREKYGFESINMGEYADRIRFGGID